MIYTISEVKEKFSISDSTLRYYEKAGLISGIEKDSSGRRIYLDTDVDWIGMIVCMRKTGMGIRDIRHFVELCNQGNDSIEERLHIFKEQRKKIDLQFAELQSYSEKVNEKIAYYQKKTNERT